MPVDYLKDSDLDSFVCAEIPNPENNGGNANILCCLYESDHSYFVWLVGPEFLFRTSISDKELQLQSTNASLTPAEFLTAIRTSLDRKSLKFSKSSSNAQISFKSSTGAEIKLILEPVEFDSLEYLSLLFNMARSHDRQRREISSLKKRPSMTGSPGGSGMSPLGPPNLADIRRTPSRGKRQKTASTGTSVINPQSRMTKPAKGITFDDDDE